MARSRILKIGFFENEQLASCSPFARLLYAGLWCLADRDGKLEDRPARIKGRIFPYDQVEIEGLLDELATHRFINRYSVDEVYVIQIPTFRIHQRPHRDETCFDLPSLNGQSTEISRNPAKDCALSSSSSSLSFLIPPTPQRGDRNETEFSSTEPSPSSRASAPTEIEFVQAWNEVPSFVHCRAMTGQRRRWFRARLTDPVWIDSWRNALNAAARLPFFAGKNDRGWRATVDWFLRPDSVTKILEGVYDGLGGKGPPRANPPKPVRTEADLKEAMEREKQAREKSVAAITPEIRAALRGIGRG